MARGFGWLAVIGPGVLIAATGVGAGDLATAAFTGSHVGTAALWAVVVGAALKFTVNEGIARWQLATDQTLLEGAARRLGRPVMWLFLPYLMLWSFFVGSALMSACGVTLHAMVPVLGDPARGKVVFGVVHGAVGAALVLAGGFALFERVMAVCVAVMFGVVVVTAGALWPGTGQVVHGLVVPSIPDAGGQGLAWTVALIGGVGGTLTVLCYGYWIREKGRRGLGDVRVCRVDLAVGYAMTALFGLAMVIIGSTVTVDGRGAGLVVILAERLEGRLGPAGKWAFLVGAWGAVFSSLLGVWQAVPYLFVDAYRAGFGRPHDSHDSHDANDSHDPRDSLSPHDSNDPRDSKAPDGTADPTRTWAYRGYLLALATVPMLGLWLSFKEVQKLYAIIGALFFPMLAVALLVMNGRARWVGAARNSWLATSALVATLAFFGWVALRGWF